MKKILQFLTHESTLPVRVYMCRHSENRKQFCEKKSGVFVTNCQNVAILVSSRNWTFEINVQSFEGLNSFDQVYWRRPIILMSAFPTGLTRTNYLANLIDRKRQVSYFYKICHSCHRSVVEWIERLLLNR